MYLRSLVLAMLYLFLLTAACSPAGTPTAQLNPDGSYSLATRTGMEEIDRILVAVAGADRAKLESLIQYTTAPCTTRDGLGGPPKCLRDEAEGTPVEAFPSVGSEGSFIRKAEIDRWTGVHADALFAVYRVSGDGVEEQYYPRGEYAIVFLSGDTATAVTLRIQGGRIVRVDYPFYESLQELKNQVAQDASEVILVPNIR